VADGLTLPVVLLHGQPASAAVWEQVRAALPVGMRILAPDRPGYGLNPAPPRGFAGNMRALLDSMDSAEIDRAIVVAHSWATAPAILAASRFPDRVSGLVLASTLGPGALHRLDRVLASPIIGEVAAYGGLNLAGPALRRYIRSMLRDKLRGVRLARFEHRLEANRLRPVWRSFLVEQRAMFAELDSVIMAMPGVRAPTIVVHGTNDPEIPVSTAEFVTATIPGARLELVHGVGHALPLDAPERLAAAIVSCSEAA
jgi:pimeloyl-ACP methyl ester carboxylesterase